MRIAVTTGEPAGVGPEIAMALAHWFQGHKRRHSTFPVDELVLIGDQNWLAHYGYDPQQLPNVRVQSVPLRAPAIAGQLNVLNAEYVLEQLMQATQMALAGDVAALVTAPVHKGIINDAGVPFSGHTEFFQELSSTPKVVMMLACDVLKVALATTHLALRDVPIAITKTSLIDTMLIIHRDLQQRFGIVQPRIAVCGLNPHAGEQGHLGDEEVTTITPAIQAVRELGVDAQGPYPADTIFVSQDLVGAYDVVLAMYHDQGLPVLKRASFGTGVNITLGLPFVRTSVDHGTALGIAGKQCAETNSLQQAFLMAVDMATKV